MIGVSCVVMATIWIQNWCTTIPFTDRGVQVVTFFLGQFWSPLSFKNFVCFIHVKCIDIKLLKIVSYYPLKGCRLRSDAPSLNVLHTDFKEKIQTQNKILHPVFFIHFTFLVLVFSLFKFLVMCPYTSVI